jgi:hypothetical protein
MQTLDSKPAEQVPDSRLDADRARARKRVQERRDFGANAFAYVVVNTFLVLLWVVTGASYFWPAWIMAGWGVGLVMHAWNVYLRRPVTEADVDAELKRFGRPDR